MDWFKDWFDSKYYHILYQDRNDKEAKDFIHRLFHDFQLNEKQKIMDLACGKGRHSVYMNQLGFDVTGLDLSANSIEFAKQFENDRLRFDTSDMREIYARNSFDVICNFFTSFGYFDDLEDNQKVFDSVYAQLKLKGIFILDYLNVEKTIKNLVKEETKELNGISFRIKRLVEEGKIYKKISFSDQEKPHEFVEKISVLRLGDFEYFAKQSNFIIHKVFGNYELDDFDSQNSDRCIIIMKR